MLCRSAAEADAARAWIKFQREFRLLPSSLGQSLLTVTLKHLTSKTARQDVSLKTLLACMQLNGCGEWEWKPGVFGDLAAQSFGEVLDICDLMEDAVMETIWKYAIHWFGSSVASYLGFTVTDRQGNLCTTELTQCGLLLNDDHKHPLPLEWVSGELRCNRLRWSGYQVAVPNWPSSIAFFRELKLTWHCAQHTSTLLVTDLVELVQAYLVPFLFYKVYQENLI